MESCSRVCLLVVSRLLGLTLRLFAPVCSCHRDSLTRGRLAIVQDAVRVFFSSVSSIGSARDDICPVVSGSLRGMSLRAVLKCERPAALVKLFFTLLSFPCISAQFLTTCSAYAWARSKCATSWWVECTISDTWRTNPTNILNTESFCHVWFAHLRASIQPLHPLVGADGSFW